MIIRDLRLPCLMLQDPKSEEISHILGIDVRRAIEIPIISLLFPHRPVACDLNIGLTDDSRHNAKSRCHSNRGNQSRICEFSSTEV